MLSSTTNGIFRGVKNPKIRMKPPKNQSNVKPKNEAGDIILSDLKISSKVIVIKSMLY